MEKERLQQLLVGKVISQADLSHGTVKLGFSDGTFLQREKTCEGEIIATLYDHDHKIIIAVKI